MDVNVMPDPIIGIVLSSYSSSSHATADFAVDNSFKKIERHRGACDFRDFHYTIINRACSDEICLIYVYDHPALACVFFSFSLCISIHKTHVSSMTGNFYR